MSNLFESSIDLYRELTSKNFPRDNPAAYLSCFLNIGTIDKFLIALEKEAAKRDTKLIPHEKDKRRKKR